MRPNRLAGLLLVGALCTWMALAPRQDAAAPSRLDAEFYFHHDHILGTSLDVWLIARDETESAAVEDAILTEIERLRRIFSLYDPESELSRLNRTRAPMGVSPEMIEVLRSYERFQACSSGAFNGQLGALVRVWQEAEKSQCEPDDATVSRIVQEIRAPGWRLDETTGTVIRLTDQPLNLNSIAKGYIIQKAADAARRKVGAVRGLLLNLGGDMFAWDEAARGWLVGVQNPRAPHDNAEPIARVRLRDRAIATSGGYERYYTIGAKRHSHIFDPRTGRSAQGAAGATVIAADNVTANALATTLCVLSPEEGLRLVASFPGVECLLVGRDGRQFRSPGFAAFEAIPEAGGAVGGDKKEAEKKGDAWPEGFQVNLTVSLPSVASKRYRRPYVAIWVENGEAKPVRTITVWGNNPRWVKDLPQWWKFAKNDSALVKAVTRATRSPGKYTLVWDGKDDKGAALPRGTYTIYVEVHREHGKLVRQTGKLTCDVEPATLTLDKNAETGDTLIEYAKKKAP
ncbi:MAG: DUF2271 domain-containing protein [Gemmataceae bacterium]